MLLLVFLVVNPFSCAAIARKKKQPYFVHIKDGQPLLLACLYDTWSERIHRNECSLEASKSVKQHEEVWRVFCYIYISSLGP